MLLVLRWSGLGAAEFSLSILLQRNFLLEPSSAFGGLILAYRTAVTVLLGWMEPVFASALQGLAHGFGVGELRLALRSDALIQDGFIVLAVFMVILSRGLTAGRSGVVALIVFGIDPFSSYLGVGAALVPVLFIATLAAIFATMALAPRLAGRRAEVTTTPSHMARDLALITFAAALLLAANVALRSVGL